MPPNEIAATAEVDSSSPQETGDANSDSGSDSDSVGVEENSDASVSDEGAFAPGGGLLPEGDDENPAWNWDTWDGGRDSLPQDHHEIYDKIQGRFDEETNIFDRIFGSDDVVDRYGKVDYSKYMDRDEHDRLVKSAVESRLEELTQNLDQWEPHNQAIQQLKASWAEATQDWEQQSDRSYKLMASMTNELVEANKIAQQHSYAHQYYYQETQKWANETIDKYGSILNDKSNPQRQWYIDAIKAKFDPRAATGLLGAPKQAWVKALSMWKKGLDPDSAVKEALSSHPQRGIPKQVTASFVGGHRIREAGSDQVRISDPNLSDREARKLAFRRASGKINSKGGR